MRDGSDEKPCILFSAKEVQPTTNPAETQVEEDKGTQPFSPAPTRATEWWSTRPWPFTPCAEPFISCGGPVAEEKSNLCYMYGTTADEEPIEKAPVASSSAVIKFRDSVNSNLVTTMVNRRTSGHYIDDAIIRDLKHRRQDYAHLATPRKIHTAGGALLDGTAEGVLEGVVIDDYGNQILVRVGIVVGPGIGRNLFSVTTAAQKGIVTIFDYENPRLEGINDIVPLPSENGDL